MRLIDADALKKYMDDCGWCDNCPDKKRLCEMDCRFPDFCTHEWQRVIDEQPTITASPWRRVEEPPKEYGNYLAVVNGEVMEVTYSDRRDDWKWSTCDADGFVWIRSELVTHWMPLPEPPKEEEHGN